MKIICTLFMRDEEDVIDEWFKHHHDMFDIFLVTDNGSGDMSAEIAAKYSKVKRLWRDFDLQYPQERCVNGMVGVARDMGADWVVNSDADEFWYNIDYLRKAPQDVGAVVTHTQLWHLPISGVELPYHGWTQACQPYYQWGDLPKAMFRPGSNTKTMCGNHHVVDPVGRVVETYEQDANDELPYFRHYSIRSWRHFHRKVANGGPSVENAPHMAGRMAFHWKKWFGALRLGQLQHEYNKLCVSEHPDSGRHCIWIKDCNGAKRKVKYWVPPNS